MFSRKTRTITVGNVKIGGGAPVSIQSMTNTDTRDVEATLGQITRLRDAGCEIVRLAVPDMEAAEALDRIVRGAPLPVVADIHFDYRLALRAVKAGVAKIRINPGNIGDEGRVRAVAQSCREAGVPIRIGVNGGSLSRDILAKFGAPTPEAMVESALLQAKMLEDAGFFDIAVSLKSSSVRDTVAANVSFAKLSDIPLHVGVTETGTARMGLIKSAAGIGGLLALGVGETMRVSLTSDPVEEIAAARDILAAVGLRRDRPELISCPTCGRCRIDLIPLANEVEQKLKDFNGYIKVAVMGCAVNGPGEAREADIGIAGGDGDAVLFIKGEIVRKLPRDQIVSGLMDEIRKQYPGKFTGRGV